MECVLLADAPEALEKVAHWYFNEWCKESGRYTYEAILAKISKSTNRRTAPLMVLIKLDGELVAAAELKIREMTEFPQYEFWLGGVYVEPDHRGKGIAAMLVDEIKGKARQAGVRELYLQTEALGGGLYSRKGFKPVTHVVSTWGECWS